MSFCSLNKNCFFLNKIDKELTWKHSKSNAALRCQACGDMPWSEQALCALRWAPDCFGCLTVTVTVTGYYFSNKMRKGSERRSLVLAEPRRLFPPPNSQRTSATSFPLSGVLTEGTSWSRSRSRSLSRSRSVPSIRCALFSAVGGPRSR